MAHCVNVDVETRKLRSRSYPRDHTMSWTRLLASALRFYSNSSGSAGFSWRYEVDAVGVLRECYSLEVREWTNVVFPPPIFPPSPQMKNETHRYMHGMQKLTNIPYNLNVFESNPSNKQQEIPLKKHSIQDITTCKNKLCNTFIQSPSSVCQQKTVVIHFISFISSCAL